MRSNLILVVLAVAALVAQAQAQKNPECVKALAPCAPFVNSTAMKPTSDCCKPLFTALDTTLTCVCSIYGNTQFLQTMKFDVKTALSLPARCGLKFDLQTGCIASSTPPPALAPAADGPSSDGPSSDGPSSDDASAPGAPTTSVTTTPSASDSKSGASKSLLSGFAMLGSFLVWTTMMFY